MDGSFLRQLLLSGGSCQCQTPDTMFTTLGHRYISYSADVRNPRAIVPPRPGGGGTSASAVPSKLPLPVILWSPGRGGTIVWGFLKAKENALTFTDMC